MYGRHEPKHPYSHFYYVNLSKATDACIDLKDLSDSDLIIYAAGAGIQSNLHEDSNLIYKLNTFVPVMICNMLNVHNFLGTIVTFGSYFEMGEVKEQKLFTESEIVTSLSPSPNEYTNSKRMFTRFISSYQHNFRHWHFILPTIYGKGENQQRLIPYTINAIKQGKPLHFTTGDQVRQYLHVSEVPYVLDLSLRKQLPNGIYNIAGADILSVKQLVILIHKQLGKQVSDNCFGSVVRKDIGMKYLALDGKKLSNKIEWQSHTNLEEGIQVYLKDLYGK